jgi:hypothetical protein
MALIYEPGNPYWSPAQVRLYIDGWWIDDAAALQWTVRDDKRPKWGYNDRTYRATAMGRTIVEGQISVLFRYNNYLLHVASKFTRRTVNSQVADEMARDLRTGYKDSTSYLPDSFVRGKPNDILDWLTKAAQSPERNAYNMAKAYLTTKYHKIKGIDGAKLSSSTIANRAEYQQAMQDGKMAEAEAILNFQRVGLLTRGFDIMIVYGTEHKDILNPAKVKFIQDVHITGEGQRAEISPPEGSTAIREVYQFFAKDVRAGRPGARSTSRD